MAEVRAAAASFAFRSVVAPDDAANGHRHAAVVGSARRFDRAVRRARRAFARSTTSRSRQSRMVTALFPSTRAPKPPQRVQFVLVAPDAKKVAVVGDFNGWDASITPAIRRSTAAVACGP